MWFVSELVKKLAKEIIDNPQDYEFRCVDKLIRIGDDSWYLEDGFGEIFDYVAFYTKKSRIKFNFRESCLMKKAFKKVRENEANKCLQTLVDELKKDE